MKVFEKLIEKLYLPYFAIKEKITNSLKKDVEVILVGEVHNSMFHAKLKERLIEIYNPDVILYECPSILTKESIQSLLQKFKEYLNVSNFSKFYTIEEYIEHSLRNLNLSKCSLEKIKKEIEEFIEKYNVEASTKISIDKTPHIELNIIDYIDFASYLRVSLLNTCFSNQSKEYQICSKDIFQKLFEDLKKYLSVHIKFIVKNTLPTLYTLDIIINKYKKDIICIDEFDLEKEHIEIIRKSLSSSIPNEIEVLLSLLRKKETINEKREGIMAKRIIENLKEGKRRNKHYKILFIGGSSHVKNIENILQKNYIRTKSVLLPKLSNNFEDSFEYLLDLTKLYT